VGAPVDPYSLTSLAKRVDLSVNGLKKALEDGRCPPIPVPPTSAAEWATVARRQIKARTRPALSNAARKQQRKPVNLSEVVGEIPEADGDETLAEAARQLEWEKLREKQIKNEREEGRLVEVVVINAFVAGMIMKARDELIRIGAEIADRLARESDPAKCRALVDDRISQSLEALTEYRPT
jgi:hypothetical protein